MNDFQEIDYTKKLDFGLWIKLFQYLKNCKKEAVLLCLINVMVSGISAAVPIANKYALDVFVEQRNLSTFPPFVIVYILLVISNGYLFYKVIRYSAMLEVTIVHDIRERAFEKLQRLSFSYYDTTAVGWIMSRMTSDAQRIGDVIAWGCMDVIWALAMMSMFVIMMLLLNVKMALLTLSVMPVLFILSVFFQKRILGSQREVRKINSKITASFNEGINGARTTKTLVREEKNFEEFSVLSKEMKGASLYSAKLSAIYLPVVMFLGSISLGLVLYSGGNQFFLNIISFGTLSAFLTYAAQIFEPIQQIARIFAEMQAAQAAAERTLSLIDTAEEVQDSPEIVGKYGDVFNPKVENWEPFHGNIEFKDVSFSYKTGEPVLKHFNLKVENGQRIALVGATGSGKSTIVNLLCRFYEPVTGQILLDGKDYRERSQLWLHANIGYVLQTPHLFSGTIEENIRYGCLDATEEDIIAAAKTVNAYDFIMKLERGFKTDVGEGGNRLSAGEKQLISFARAIIGKPAIFVLDEATSSIDTETEQVIQDAIFKVLAGRTSFIVAHRLSTIRSCDRILVIDKGEILESGTHKELINKKGRYYQLYTNQFVEDRGREILNQ